MRKSWTTQLHLNLVVALGCAASASLAQNSAAQAQDTFISRLLEYEPAVLEADRAQFDRAQQERDQLERAPLYQDDSVEQASLLQQPAGQPAAPGLDAAARRSTRGSRQANVGLASVPNMFGDCGPTTANITILGNGTITEAGFMLPVIGGARTAKIAENGNSLPVDRIYFNYNHFNGIFEMQSQSTVPPGPTRFRSEPIDRYTLGYEKTFFDQWTSIELRMPFTGSYYATLPGIAVDSGNYGNLAVILKALFYQDDNLGIGFGLGIDTPTGSSTVARTAPANLRFQNQAAHILPYVGFLYSPGDPQFGWGDSWFMSGFIQVDAATNGNTVSFEDPATQARTDLGKFTEQTVMYYDLAFGYWLYRDSEAERITGLAAITELHYITAVQDADLVAGTTAGAGAVITNPLNRFDVMNGTVGLQTLFFDKSSLRVAGVFPFGQQADKRFFDAEVQVQFNRRF